MKRYCQLCSVELTSKNRRKSHILTKASFFDKQHLKSGEHAILIVGNKNPKIIDPGHHVWEYLLCSDCEQKVAVWEQERERFLSLTPRPTKPPTDERFFEVKGFNKEYIALACLADLFRGSVAHSEAYSKIRLGEKHESRIKEILNDGRVIDFFEYPIVFSRFMKSSDEIDEVIKYPQRVKLPHGDHCYNIYETIAPDGWVWMIKVDSQKFELMNRCAIGSATAISVLNQGNLLTDSQNVRFRRTLSKTIHAIDSIQGLNAS